MKPRWLRGKEGELYRKDLTTNFLQSDLTRERLIEMLEEEIDQSLVEMRDAVRGNIPNLAAYYASELSKQEALENVIQLLKE